MIAQSTALPSLRRIAVPLVLIAALMGGTRASAKTTPTATTQPASKPSRAAIARAGELFLKGVELYKERSFAEALQAFREAYSIAPHYRVLYNIGSTSRFIGDYAGARRAYRRYLREGATRISPDREAEVKAHLDEIDKKVARLRVSANVDGARVRVDGLDVGTTPLPEILILNPGPHEVVATKGEAPPASHQLSLAPGQEQTLRLEILPYLPASNPVRPRSYKKFWIAAATTGALAVAAISTGVLALDAQSRWDEELEKYPPSLGDAEGARSDARNYALATDILIASAAVAAGVATYFLVAEWRRSAEGEREDATNADELRARSSGISISPLGVVLRGRF